MNDKYNTLKNALIVEKNDRLLKEYEKLMIEIDREDNDKYLEEYKKYDYMALTIEDEEERLNNLINVIKSRENIHKQLEEDYSYITGEEADFLIDVLDFDKLPDLENRLDTINRYLSIKDRIVNLSLNIKEYNKELKTNPDNRRIHTKLNKSTKKINTLLNSLKKENILVLLYEFCIIDSFNEDEVENSIMLKNILSTKIKKREEKVNKKIEIDKDIKDNTVKINNDKKSINISDASIFIVPGEKLEITDSDNIFKEKSEDYIDANKEDIDDNSKQDDIVIVPKNKDINEEKTIENQEELSEIEEDTNAYENEEDYVKQMVPIDMLKIDKIGTVRPVSIMEKLENAQEEEGDLTIPSMGILNKNNEITIDSNDFLKNSTKSDKMS